MNTIRHIIRCDYNQAVDCLISQDDLWEAAYEFKSVETKANWHINRKLIEADAKVIVTGRGGGVVEIKRVNNFDSTDMIVAKL